MNNCLKCGQPIKQGAVPFWWHHIEWNTTCKDNPPETVPPLNEAEIKADWARKVKETQHQWRLADD